MTENRAPYDYEVPALAPGDRVGVVLRNGEIMYDTVRDFREDPPESGNYVLETASSPRLSGRIDLEAEGFRHVGYLDGQQPEPLIPQADWDAAVAAPRDILDDIDAVLAEGEPHTGYDYDDPTFPKCPRGCGRKWHGMAVTARIEIMAVRGDVDPDYRYSDDDSTVLCPAPDFIGPVKRAMPTVAEVGEYRAALMEYQQVHLEGLFAVIGLPYSLDLLSAINSGAGEGESAFQREARAIVGGTRPRNSLLSMLAAIRGSSRLNRRASGGRIIGPLS